MPISKVSFASKRLGSKYTTNYQTNVLTGTLSGASVSTLNPSEKTATWAPGNSSGSFSFNISSPTTPNPSGLAYYNKSRNLSSNIIKTTFTAVPLSWSFEVLLVGGGAGGGNPRGNGPGGEGGGAGYVYTGGWTAPGNSGTFPVSVGSGGAGGSCDNQSGRSGGTTTGFGGYGGSGGGGMSEHNGNCNGCGFSPGNSLTNANSSAGGISGGCNFGAGAGSNSFNSNISGTNYNYGSRGNYGGGSGIGGSGTGGVTIMRWNSSNLNIS